MNPYECSKCGGTLGHESDCPQRPAAEDKEKLMQR